MGIEPTAGGCPATGFEDQERHQAANYSLVPMKDKCNVSRFIVSIALLKNKCNN
jgi:hypothetical protein